jgi:hypothetical protein
MHIFYTARISATLPTSPGDPRPPALAGVGGAHESSAVPLKPNAQKILNIYSALSSTPAPGGGRSRGCGLARA